MKPEASGGGKSQDSSDKPQEASSEGEPGSDTGKSVAESPSATVMDLTEDVKTVLNLLKANSPIDLNELKAQTGLSNKKWDKAIKGLTKNKLAKVEKTEEGLYVSLV